LDSGGWTASKGDAGKYGVETMLTVISPFMSQIGDKAMAVAVEAVAVEAVAVEAVAVEGRNI
jgi:hypothetical protein